VIFPDGLDYRLRYGRTDTVLTRSLIDKLISVRSYFMSYILSSSDLFAGGGANLLLVSVSLSRSRNNVQVGFRRACRDPDSSAYVVTRRSLYDCSALLKRSLSVFRSEKVAHVLLGRQLGFRRNTE